MRAEDIASDLAEVLLTETQIHDRIVELAREIERDIADGAGKAAADGAAKAAANAGAEHPPRSHPPLFIGVLTGAIMFMADLTRELRVHTEFEFMALSSYGSGTESSGEVRIVKDLSADIAGRDIIIIEDIVDTGLTLDWLIRHLRARGAASVRVCALLRKPDAARVQVDLHYLGFDIPNAFVVGYGLDYAGRYRNLRDIAVIAPHAVHETADPE